MIVAVRYSHIIGETLEVDQRNPARRRIHSILLILAVFFAAGANPFRAQHAVGADYDWRYGNPTNAPVGQVRPYKVPRAPIAENPGLSRPADRPPVEDHSRAIRSQQLPAEIETSRTPPQVRAAATRIRQNVLPHQNAHPGANPATDWVVQLIDAIRWTLMFVVVAVLAPLVWAFKGGIATAIDRLFEVPGHDHPTTANALDGADGDFVLSQADLDAHFQPHYSADDVRQQTEVLRALKAELDEAVQTARSAIHRAQSHCQQEPERKANEHQSPSDPSA